MDEIEYTMKQIQDWIPTARATAAGDELRALRKSGGLTQLEAGKVLGVEQWEISKFERGLTPIPEGLRSDLAAYLTGGEVKTGKTHISARIPADLRHHIEQFSKSEGVSFTAALKKIIKEHAEQGDATDTPSELGLRVIAMEGSLDAIVGTLVDANKATTKLTSLVSGLVDKSREVDALMERLEALEEAAEVADFSAPPPSPRPVYTLPAIEPKERSPLAITETEESGEAVAAFEPAPPWRPSPWGWVKAAGARFLFRELRPFRALDVAVFLRLARLSTLRPFLTDLVSKGWEDLTEGCGPAVISKHLAMLRDWVPTEPTTTKESAAARYAARALGYVEEIDKAEKMTPEGLEELKADARSRNFSRSQRALDHYRGTVEYQIQRLKVIHSAGWRCSDCGAELTNTPNKPESAQWDHAHYHNPTEERQGVDAFAVCSACHTKRERARGRI
ncbi:MAG: hypothetical protein CL678_02190 [Bdellovibrionaceae bacterium]|nr:hypothetical protein [Pseudobdellovibrionaceae bacterium]|tara:strand:- start:17383 stop:18729 length:1347 start_codon:yes stop_codon:yes gene_type:complete